MNVSLFPEVNKVTGTNHQSSPMQKMLLRGNKLGRESFPARSCQQTSVPEEEPFLSYREVGSFWDFAGTNPVVAEENITKETPQMSPPRALSVSIYFRSLSGSMKTLTFSVFWSSPLDKCTSQTASAKAQKWTNMWLALHGSKHHITLDPEWHSNRSQWTEKEFWCKSSPRGIVGILQESSYSWSLIIENCQSVKYSCLRVRLSSLKHEEGDCGPLEMALQCVHTEAQEKGNLGAKGKKTQRCTLFTRKNEYANHRKVLIMYLKSTIICKMVNKESNKITKLRHKS